MRSPLWFFIIRWLPSRFLVTVGRHWAVGNRPPINYRTTFSGDFARLCSWIKQTGRDMVHRINIQKDILTFVEKFVR